jgi:hypothetical protein
MARTKVVGVGPGATSYLTKEVEAELLGADKVFFRTGTYPVYEWLRGLGKYLVCFDKSYDTGWDGFKRRLRVHGCRVVQRSCSSWLGGVCRSGESRRAGGYDKSDSGAGSERGSRGESAAGVSFLDCHGPSTARRLKCADALIGITRHRKATFGSSRQGCKSCEMKVLVPPIAYCRADSMSDACEGNDARSARM